MCGYTYYLNIYPIPITSKAKDLLLVINEAAYSDLKIQKEVYLHIHIKDKQ